MHSSREHSAARPVGDAARAVAPATAPRNRAPLDLRLFALQQQAGNAAVASMLAGAHPVARPSAGAAAVQREPASAAPAPAAAPAGNAAMSGQLGALWEGGVVVPLARAADRLGREDKDLVGARTDLTGALQMIRTVRSGTLAGDPNLTLLTTVERIVKSVLDVVEQRLGGATSDGQFERELLTLRLEAVGLQPMVTKRPPIDDLVSAIMGEAAADFEVPSDLADMSATELWQVFVINILWGEQRDFHQLSPRDAFANVTRVGVAIQRFREAAAGSAVYARLFALEAGFTALLSRLKERIPADSTLRATADDLAHDSTRAYELGAKMKGYLTGEPAAAETPPGAAGTGEPDFTWERPFENDTDLMRPGE